MEEIDVELFTEQVRNHPELWNVGVEEYKDRNKKTKDGKQSVE